MVVFPNCKINIGLQITGKRTDGFHNLETIFIPVQIKDALEIIEAKDEKEPLIYSTSGNIVEGKQEDNLCIRAYDLIKKDHPHLPNIKLHLHKTIPSGAGLGGGSADAAFTLQLLNKLFSLNISTKKFAEYALQLGSDCPFFLLNTPVFATGRGEIVEPINVDLSPYKILIVNRGIHVNTGWAFTQLDLTKTRHTNLKTAVLQPIANWKENIHNDFEIPVFSAHPEIKIIKENLYQQGALYAAMSGSGSSVFAIFEKKATPVLNFPSHYFCAFV